MNGFVLSIFPGIGLLDLAFELEGFCVVRGPDVLWGGDVRKFHPPAGKFDGVIGGPPCQAFSRLAHMVRQSGREPKFGNLIPEFERCVFEAAPKWFLMEEVVAAPRPRVEGYGVWDGVLNNRQCVDQLTEEPSEQNRTRAISFGWRGPKRVLEIETVCFENRRFSYAVIGGTNTRERPAVRIGGSGKPKPSLRRATNIVGNNIRSESTLAESLRLQGLPADFLENCPLTVAGKCKAIGNGVPLPMGRALARAVRETIEATGKNR